MRTGSSTVGEYRNRTRRAGGCCHRASKKWSRDRRCPHRSRSVGGCRCPQNVPWNSTRCVIQTSYRSSKSISPSRRDERVSSSEPGIASTCSSTTSGAPRHAPTGSCRSRTSSGRPRSNSTFRLQSGDPEPLSPVMLGTGRGVIVNVCSRKLQLTTPTSSTTGRPRRHWPTSRRPCQRSSLHEASASTR